MPTVLLAGALDTKGAEYAFAREHLRRAGIEALLVDTGVLDGATVRADIDRAEVAAAAGATLAEVVAAGDRSRALAVMSAGLAAITAELHRTGRIDAALAFGGSGVLAVASRAFRELPLGVPKLIVTTMAASDTAPFIGASDLVLMPSVVDIAGVNRVSAFVIRRAVAVLGALLGVPARFGADGARRAVAASMFGVTTPGVSVARRELEARGYEVLVFHANGTGGRTLENVVESGWVDAVLDLTTTEVTDEIVGGVASAGPDRLGAAARRGIPQVISIGATEVVNFWAPDTVPARFAGRRLYHHNPTATLMRTSAEEAALIGLDLAARINRSTGPVEVLLPLGGTSSLSVPGGPFADPVADRALVDALRQGLRPEVPVLAVDDHINAPEFGALAAARLANVMQAFPMQ
jgi:uncharacterized protein (UPF0261 family)